MTSALVLFGMRTWLTDPNAMIGSLPLGAFDSKWDRKCREMQESSKEVDSNADAGSDENPIDNVFRKEKEVNLL